MFYLVLALIQFETTLTNASPQALSSIKFHLIALSLILAVQIFYYSQAILYRTINMGYGQLRAFMFLIAALMMSYANIKRDNDIKITISRQMALKSVVLFSVGIYLVVLGVMGEGLKYCSGNFSRSFGVSLAFLLGTGLLLLLLSDRVRREVKVVLHKNFYQNKHDYRTQWLLLTEKLSSPSWDDLLHSVLEIYTLTFGISGATLFLYEENRGAYLVSATYQMKMKNEIILPENSLVQLMQKQGWVFFIRDQVKEVIEENRQLFDEHQISFIVPLPDTYRLEGFIVLGKMVKPDEAYIYEDFDLMKTFARQAVQAIRQQRLSRALLQTREEAAVGNVATFVMHDLKNQLTALSLISENAPRLITNPDFQKDLLVSLQGTVHKMQGLIGNLKTLDKQKLLYLENADLLDILTECSVQLSGANIIISGEHEFVHVDRAEIQKVVMNLLVNAIEASEPGMPVNAEVGTVDEFAYLKVKDTGSGMSPQFVESELFVPFHSTKASGLGIGLFQCRQIIQAHNGKIEVETAQGKGSTFTVWLPYTQELA
jgi:putative PEP-CTERM system histidine kinase